MYLTTRQLHNYTNVATAYSVKIVDTSYLTFFHKYFISVCESLAQLLLTNDIIMARCTRRSSYTHIYIRVEQLLWNYVFTRIIDIISPSSYLDIYACLWHKTIICCDQIMWKKKDFLDFSLYCASHNLATVTRCQLVALIIEFMKLYCMISHTRCWIKIHTFF